GVGLAARGEVVVVVARVAAGDHVGDEDAAVGDAGGRERRGLGRRVVAGRTVDQDPDRVVVVDARVVDRQGPRRERRTVARVPLHARDVGDPDAEGPVAEAARNQVAVLALVDGEPGDVRAADRALGVDVRDPGGRVDAVRVDRHARDVHRDRIVLPTDYRDDHTELVAQVLVVGGDPLVADGGRLDRDLVGTGAAQVQVLVDRQHGRARRAGPLRVGTGADRDRVAGRGVLDRVADALIAGVRTARALLPDGQRLRAAATLRSRGKRQRGQGGHDHQRQLASHVVLPS